MLLIKADPSFGPGPLKSESEQIKVKTLSKWLSQSEERVIMRETGGGGCDFD